MVFQELKWHAVGMAWDGMAWDDVDFDAAEADILSL